MSGILAMSVMRPPSAPIREVSGAFDLRGMDSKLPSEAKMATLMARTGGHMGNTG